MSTLVQRKDLDNISRLILSSGRGNPLSPETLEALNKHLDELTAEPPKAVIIDADGASVFSGGFALPIIATWEREKLAAFLNRFLDALHKLMRLPCVTISAIEGSAVAGGFILTLASDFRIVGTNPKLKLGLPEVNLGAALPAGARVLFEARTSVQSALYYSATAELFGSEEAKRIGYATSLSDQPLEAAISFATKLASKPGIGVGITTQLAGEPILQAMQEADEAGMERFLDSWFHPEAHKMIQAQAERLRR